VENKRKNICLRMIVAGQRGYHFDWVASESLAEKMLFEWRPEESQGAKGYMTVLG